MSIKLPINGFVKFLGEQVAQKAGYIMASYGQNPRTGYLDLAITTEKSTWKPSGWYYAQYSGKQRTKALYWREHCKRVFDCQGLSEGYYEIMTGECVNTQARYNYANWCDPKGSGMIPANKRVPGAAVFWGSSASSIHHVGYLEKPVKEGHPEGDWYIVEARGVMYGVVRTKLYERKPNYWGIMRKYFDYSETAAEIKPTKAEFGSRVLRNGDEGADVGELQSALIRLGFDCGVWGSDCDFGDATEIAVKSFQSVNNLDVDGVVGPKTFAALELALIKLEKPAENPKKVVIYGGTCYVREAPNTKGGILGAVIAGTELEYANEKSDEDWHKVVFKDKIGWVSGKYSRLA